MFVCSVCRLSEDGTVQSNVAVGTPDYISPEILRVRGERGWPGGYNTLHILRGDVHPGQHLTGNSLVTGGGGGVRYCVT